MIGTLALSRGERVTSGGASARQYRHARRASQRLTALEAVEDRPRGLVACTDMTYVEAAAAVLRRARRPLMTREVIETAIRRRLIEPDGKTPEATMAAELYRALRRRTEIVKLAEPGPQRARRGTVRWTVK
jgi:HB1/ASXL restriction endonuclease-like protein with HTH domain